MKQLLMVFLFGLLSTHSFSQVVSSPDVFTRVNLSSSNPNRLVCVNGNINDVSFPKEIPVEGVPKGENFFISYKFKDRGNRVEYVTKSHDFHVICGGEVYSLTAKPTPGIQGGIIWLGDPAKKQLIANANLLREKSTEDLYIYLIMSAFHNDYAGNISVTEANAHFPYVVPGVSIRLVREMSLNGAGLRLKEFVLFASPGTNVQKERFLEAELSPSALAVATYPPIVGKDRKSRLFIVERKL